MTLSLNSRIHKASLGILVSGRGSNMVAIIKACRKELLKAQVGVVVSNNPLAPALKKAQEYNIPHFFFDNEKETIACLLEHSVDLICLAGYMKIISPHFIQTFFQRIINIHPSLLPKYKGLHTHRRVLKSGEKETGCTVHYVDEEVDSGKIILQTKVPVLAEDTEESISKRVLVKEHELYPKAIQHILTADRK